MVNRTRAEMDLICDYMEPSSNALTKADALLRMFIEGYNFDMRKPGKQDVSNIEQQWERIGQVLYSVLDYIDIAQETLNRVLLENSEEQ